ADTDTGGGRLRRSRFEPPARTVSDQRPGAACGTADLNRDRRTSFARNITIGVRQPPHRDVDHRVEESRIVERRRADGGSNLFLVVPELGEFAADIEPSFGDLLPRP